MKSTRLQGDSWYKYRRRHKLKLLCVSKSKAGNYRADCIDENGTLVYHWLHPLEKRKLDRSDYLETHVILDSNKVLHCSGDLWKKMRNREVINSKEE